MNPLTVLTGEMIMRRCEQMDRTDGKLRLDDGRRCRLTPRAEDERAVIVGALAARG